MKQLLAIAAFVLLSAFRSIVRNKGKIVISSSKRPISSSIILYTVISLIGIALTTALKLNSAVFWLFNFFGLFIAFGKYMFSFHRTVLLCVVLYLLCCVLTLVVNMPYISASIKAIGTNVNIIAAPALFFVICSLSSKKCIDNHELLKTLSGASFLGLLTLIYAIAFGYSDLVRVTNGMNVYAADAEGFFYNKNAYGGFVALTFCADLYLFYVSQGKEKRKMAVLLIIKLAAVTFSFSRAALLQAGLTTIVFVWLNRKHKGYEILLAAFAAMLMILVYLGNDGIRTFINNNILRIHIGEAGRSAIRARTWNAVQEVPFVRFLLFGVGYFGIVGLGLDLDNTYLYLLYSGGLLKIMFFAGLAIFSILKITALRKKNRLLGNLCLAVAVSYYPYAFFESVTYLELGILNFMLTLFMFIIPAGYMPDRPKNDPRV